MKTLSVALKNWKTTALAVGAALVAIGNLIAALLDDDPATVPQWSLVIGLLVTAAGLLFARDADKTSEDVGAK